MKKLILFLISFIFTLQFTSHSRGLDGSPKPLIPSDTIIYADFNLHNFPDVLRGILKKFSGEDGANSAMETIRGISISVLDLDITDNNLLSNNGFDLSSRGYFALFGIKIVGDYVPDFTFSLKVNDESKASQFIESLIHRFMKKAVFEKTSYKNVPITIINKEIKFQVPVSGVMKNPWSSYPTSYPGIKKAQALAKPDTDEEPPAAPKMKSVIFESFAYSFVDNYLYIGPVTAVKKNIDSRHFKDSLFTNQDFRSTLQKLDPKALVRGYLSAKNLSPIFFTELLDSTRGLGFTMTANDNRLELGTVYQLNPDSAVYYRTKTQYTRKPGSMDLMTYMPTGELNFANIRFNLRDTLKSMPWYMDFYLAYGAGIYYYTTSIMRSFKSYNPRPNFRLNNLLQKNMMELAKDYVHNIGNNINIIQFHLKRGDRINLKALNLLFYSEVNNPVNGYLFINKLLSLFKTSSSKNEIKEINIGGHYFHTVKWSSLELCFGLYNNFLIMATNKDTLTELINNIRNDKKTMTESFHHKKLLNKIDKSHFNFYYSFVLHEENLGRIMSDYPGLALIRNLDYIYFHEHREGDVIKGSYSLKFKDNK
ncbi:MAG: hypothetical protein OEZ36_04350 [Spirochaetota bacterium]|nr:hypothetical protein [Spirochaetota bacterium]